MYNMNSSSHFLGWGADYTVDQLLPNSPVDANTGEAEKPILVFPESVSINDQILKQQCKR